MGKVMKVQTKSRKVMKVTKAKGAGGKKLHTRQKKLTDEEIRRHANDAPSISNPKKFKEWSPPMAVKQMAFMAQYQQLHGTMTASQANSFDQKKYFTQKEISHLWMDMKRKKVKQASDALQTKWAELSAAKGRSGVGKEKKKILALSLVLPQAEWEDTVVTMTESLSDKRGSKRIEFGSWRGRWR